MRDGAPGELAPGSMAFSSAVLARCSARNRWLGSGVVTNNFPLHQLQARQQSRLRGQRWHSPGPCRVSPSCPPAAIGLPSPRRTLTKPGPALPGDPPGEASGRPAQPQPSTGQHGGPEGQLTGHRGQARTPRPSRPCLQGQADIHHLSAQGGHRGAIWHHLTGHSAAGA